jgi:hypothetical protein
VRDLFFALLLTTATATIATGGCVACTQAQEKAMEGAFPPLASCIVQTAASDSATALSDPLALAVAIASACAPYGQATANAIVSVLESWFKGAPALDGGGDAGAAVSTLALRLLRVHDTLKPLTVPEASTHD